MKRDPALTSLSHDHHEALFAAQKLCRASADTTGEARAALFAYWETCGRAHFRAEEEVLLPAYARHGDPYDELVAIVLCDHVAIRRRIADIYRQPRPAVETLHQLGELIASHVRLEELELFPLVEDTIPPAQLAAVAAALSKVNGDR